MTEPSEDCGNHLDTILRGVSRLTPEQLDAEIVASEKRLLFLHAIRDGLDGKPRRRRKVAEPEAPKKRGRPKKVEEPMFPADDTGPSDD